MATPGLTTRPAAEELRTIIVTGASSGIGAYCARALKAEGWRVFTTARKPADIAALEADGLEAFYLDYREPQSIAALVDAVLERTGGRLEALFNNGAYAQPGAVEDLPVEALREQFEANFFGWHDLTRRVMPVMRRQGHGRLVHCSSILGLAPVRFRGAYSASKHAIEGLMLCMRQELEGSGIHLSLIEPGPVTSKIASNGLPWFLKNIDVENSVHRVDYQAQLARLQAGGSVSKLKPGPEIVHKALRHALLSQRPRPHYVVTVPAKIGALLKRILPASLLYRVLARRA
ncbi:SDR family oxidoreductase [Mesorhizobium sp. M2D.F.Ca.ET.185.01.1.1]|uniref:SDR family oxidoreductase n=1 Tax=unclassified Mesorhizobium TaxID=325217 RepID=UPI000FCBDCED|nr:MULTISPECIES: SDR family oxidoreductase [unclassified Mesorhizobium]TGP83225.1 SDR family oxidoreductase [bacterium M00.F.Ca.ET.227.01.1.1]TGP99180.1 SDR family oxidoreductase [bacterium M00.F.Ca.ET.221.01.1.1]TGP99910.1 SDR family oxidoreductase [bacterium M00.F.Ca.ET.222.01.1.1]TGT78322.1 SDR family oxidoreductase [bacterium M00.F.Ca.ET.159.01.1.1]TGT88989.1 SDR family oxidoreductase [bacterium M00.F.Ca.ET.157.01.1.1]TGU11299.1 SDR family oxidoreductase [bacterium M00.F.Ca.ET.163.01.1.1]